MRYNNSKILKDEIINSLNEFKNKTKQEREHLQAVVDLGCIACAKLGIYDSPAEIHHIKGKFRMGINGRWSRWQGCI